MATDIKVTKVFASSCRVIANNYHKDIKGISIDKYLWSRQKVESKITTRIWCASCGEFYWTTEDFAKNHGGA